MAGAVSGPSPQNAAYRLRPDLELLPWDDAGDGKPRWLVHDPVSNSLDQVAWPECILLLALRKGASVGELVNAVASETTLRPGAPDVRDYLRRLAFKGWLRDMPFPAKAPEAGKAAGIFSPSWWFSHYLYFRIDLWNPGAFLAKTLPVARVLASRPVLAALTFSAVLGLYLSLPRWEEFGNGLLRMAAWNRLVWILPAIGAIKLLHEFAHAYAATAGGARVDAMGVAFVLFFPLPFVRVTDAWRLPGRKRFWVAAAGMLAEIALAALALPAWAMAPPGLGRDVCQTAASTALLSTLLVNLNPGARFDGYFMLSHLLGVENLRHRSAARLTWLWRRWFWGVQQPDPARDLRPGERFGLTGYAAYAWCYRLALYAGLIRLAYGRLPKVLGVGMVAAGVVVFLIRPFIAETGQLWRKRAEMNWRAAATLLLLGALTAWAGLDLPRRSSFPAVARTGSEIPVTAVRSGELIEADAARDMIAATGQVLARIRTSSFEAEHDRMDWAAEEAKRAAEFPWLSQEKRGQLIVRTAQAQTRSVASRAFAARMSLNELQASADGVLADWEPWAMPGVFVPRGAVLGWIVTQERPTAVGLVEVAAAERIQPGSRIRFLPDDNSEALPGTLIRVERNRLESVNDGVLAVSASGRFDGRVWRLERPMLKVVVELDRPHPRNGQSGRIWLETAPYSLIGDAWDWMRALAVRESGF